jgi:hypothetical protein
MTLSVNPVSDLTKSLTQEPILKLQEKKEESNSLGESKKTKIYRISKELLEWAGWGIVILWGGASLKEMYFPSKPVSNEALIQIFDTDGNGQLSKDEIEKAKSLIRKLGGKNE